MRTDGRTAGEVGHSGGEEVFVEAFHLAWFSPAADGVVVVGEVCGRGGDGHGGG